MNRVSDRASDKASRRSGGSGSFSGIAARSWCALAVVLPLAAVGAALFTQHAWDMQPCPWCVVQRVVFLAIAVVALPGVLLRGAWARWSIGSLVALLAASGAAAALWQHFVAASSTSCALTLADRWIRNSGLGELAPQVFAAYASCADAKVNLLGVPYEFYSLALFAVLGVVGLRVMLARR